MARASSLVLLTTAALAAVVAVHSQVGAQAKKDAGAERKQSDMMMQCPMMAGLKDIELFADSPAVLEADAKDLKLTDKQLEQLKQIEQTARRQARDLLTEEQRKHLRDAPQGRLSMMDLCMDRMKDMKDMKMPEGKMGAMCPMCMKMMRQMKQGDGSPPKQERQKERQKQE